MTKRLDISRKVLIKEIEDIKPDKVDFKEKVEKLQKKIEMVAAIPCKERDGSLTPLARQYACAYNTFYDITENRMDDAWWEIYDFVCADDTEVLSATELWTLCLLLEVYVSKL